MTTTHTLGFSDRKYLLIGIPLVAVLMVFVAGQAADVPRDGVGDLALGFVLSLMYTTINWLTYRSWYFYLHRRFPRFEQRQTRLQWLIGGTILLFGVVQGACIGIEWAVLTLLGVPEKLGHIGPLLYVIVALLCIAIMVLYESAYLMHQYSRVQVEKAELQRANMQSQLEGLRNQVNPHFLFNSLNTLSYLIPEHPGNAVKFVDHLARVYRYILEIKSRKLITLREELDFLSAYRFLLETRFEEGIDITVAVPEAYYEHQVMPLSLQLLLENAIKHNVVSASRPLHIQLKVVGDKLLITNNLQRKQQRQPSTQTGIQNIRHRYQFYTSEQVEVIATRDTFTVALPLLPAATPQAAPVV